MTYSDNLSNNLIHFFQCVLNDLFKGKCVYVFFSYLDGKVWH